MDQVARRRDSGRVVADEEEVHFWETVVLREARDGSAEEVAHDGVVGVVRLDFGAVDTVSDLF